MVDALRQLDQRIWDEQRALQAIEKEAVAVAQRRAALLTGPGDQEEELQKAEAHLAELHHKQSLHRERIDLLKAERPQLKTDLAEARIKLAELGKKRQALYERAQARCDRVRELFQEAATRKPPGSRRTEMQWQSW